MTASTLRPRGGNSLLIVTDGMLSVLAREYLGDRSPSLGDIALLLGFSEQSAFDRAFRCWTGDTPRRARAAA